MASSKKSGRELASSAFPRYSPPTTGILALVPSSWVPYIELTRITRPTGLYLFYFPHLFGTLYAACMSDEAPDAWHLLRLNIILLLGAGFLRTSACSWNDTADVEFDKHVPRCCLRPLARGALSTTQAHIVTATTGLVALACLLVLPTICWVVSVPSAILISLYPFAKRFTDFPQSILAVQVAIGFFLGIGAQDPAFLESQWNSLLAGQREGQLRLTGSMLAFYVGCICWTTVYDTVYAQQDVEFDAKAGVRSMAVHFRGYARALLGTLSAVLVGLLLAAGYLAGFGAAYNWLACGGPAAALAYMTATVDLTKPAECAWWFRNNCWLVGLPIACGLALEPLI